MVHLEKSFFNSSSIVFNFHIYPCVLTPCSSTIHLDRIRKRGVRTQGYNWKKRGEDAGVYMKNGGWGRRGIFEKGGWGRRDTLASSPPVFDMFHVLTEASPLWQFFPPTVIFKSRSPYSPPFAKPPPLPPGEEFDWSPRTCAARGGPYPSLNGIRALLPSILASIGT